MKKDFFARGDLKAARDALWGEMEVAKRIQTSLLPRNRRVPFYHLGAVMLPADEVGGDYYDVIETAHGEVWVSVGDVSGHGVESGLIMMMTQTSIFTTVNQVPGLRPAKVLAGVNSVIKQNIHRLGADRYMTLSVIKLEKDRLVAAGKHQDILVHRGSTGLVEAVPTTGTWIGVVDDLDGMLSDTVIPISAGDTVLLHTDGVTEAADSNGTMFGDERLQQALSSYSSYEVDDIITSIVRDVRVHMAVQDDDITLLALRRVKSGTEKRS